MDKIRDVTVMVGSLRKDSINRKVANARCSYLLDLKMFEDDENPIRYQFYSSWKAVSLS